MKRHLTSLVGLAIAGTVGCSDPLSSVVDVPTLVGRITAMDTTSRGQIRALVEENPLVNDPRRFGGDKIWFGIASHTVLLDGNGRTVGIDAVRIGRRAAGVARFVATSYPGQAAADTLVLD